ncbi:MAG: DUF2752 domain-containing protein [Thermotogae bacterium]|nr:DUF2752 domain-containing protein [Thermotogota bacterium]
MFACPYRSLTGIPDGGCGTTRSLLALLKGDILKSLYWNPLTLPTLLVLALFPFLSPAQRQKTLFLIMLLYIFLTLIRLVLHLLNLRVPFLYPPDL